VVFKTEYNETIAIDRKRAEAARDEVLSTYRIGEDRSSDLRVFASDDKAVGKKISATQTMEAATLAQ
jgi:PDZ domain